MVCELEKSYTSYNTSKQRACDICWRRSAMVSPPARIIMAFCRVLTIRELHVLRSRNNLRPYIHAHRRGKSKQTPDRHRCRLVHYTYIRLEHIIYMRRQSYSRYVALVYIYIYITCVCAHQRVSSVLFYIYTNPLPPKSDFARHTSTHTRTILFVTSHTWLISRAAYTTQIEANAAGGCPR